MVLGWNREEGKAETNKMPRVLLFVVGGGTFVVREFGPLVSTPSACGELSID